MSDNTKAVPVPPHAAGHKCDICGQPAVGRLGFALLCLNHAPVFQRLTEYFDTPHAAGEEEIVTSDAGCYHEARLAKGRVPLCYGENHRPMHPPPASQAAPETMPEYVTYWIQSAAYWKPSQKTGTTWRDAMTWLAEDRQRLADRIAELERELGVCKPVYEAAVNWFNFGPPHQLDEEDPGSIVTTDGDWEPFTQTLEDAVDAADRVFHTR